MSSKSDTVEEQSKTKKDETAKPLVKATDKSIPVMKTVHIKNVSQDYETVTLNGEEQILYPNNTLDVKTDKPEKLKNFLVSEYGDSLKITIK